MEVEDLLQEYSPTQIEDMFEAACPMFKPPRKNFSGIYREVHELANNFIAVALKEKLSHLEIATEEETPGLRGRVDIRVSSKSGKLDIVELKNKVAVIELKTGSLKLIQPAIYAYKEKIDVLLVGLQTREMQIVTPEVGEALIQKVADYLGKKESLRQKNLPIFGDCEKCSAFECGYAKGEELNLNEKEDIYEEKVKLLNGNLDAVVGKIAKHIENKLAATGFEKKQSFAKA